MKISKKSVVKKILSVLVAPMLAFSFGTLTVGATSGGSVSLERSAPQPVNLEDLKEVEVEFEYEDNGDGTIAITGIKEINYSSVGTYVYHLITFPETIDGKTVTKVMYLNYHMSGLIVKLPSTLQEIGDHVFPYGTLVYDNELPEGLEKIGDYSNIEGAMDRETLIMPSTLKYIGNYAFAGCGCDIVLNEGLEYIGVGALIYDSSEYGYTKELPKELTIPSTVKYIGWDAFTDEQRRRWEGDSDPGVHDADFVQENVTFKIYGGGYVEQYMKNYSPLFFSANKRGPSGYNYTVIGQIASEPTQTENVNGLSISGAIPEGADFKAEVTTTKWLDNPLFCYEISLNKDGAKVQPDGYITISIPCEYCNGYVVYIDEETGEMENLNSIYADGKYIFVTDHLSEYSVKFESEPVKADSKPDDTKTDVSTPDDTETETSKPDDTKTETSKPDNTNNNTNTNNTNTNNTNNTNNNNGTNNNNTKTTVPATGDSNTMTLFAIFGSLISAVTIFFIRRKKSV